MHPNIKCLIGQTFGKLKVIAYGGKKRGRAAWLCSCECGNAILVCSNGLLSTGRSKTRSCGCLKTLSNMSSEQRLMRRVHVSDGCWLWTGAKSYFGYGKITVNQKNYDTHRLAYELFVGLIPNNLCVLHHCDNPTCVNPNHLFLGTHLDNMVDKMRKGRANVPCGERHGLTKLTENEVIDIRHEYQEGGRRGHRDRKQGGITFQYLADKYGVTKGTVGAIISGNTWKHC